MIIIIDYDVGNVKSVANAFSYIGCDVKLSADAADIKNASGLVLAGVAAFGYAINALEPLAEAVKKAVFAGKSLLGICVGYQLLFEKSFEHGRHKGLGLLRGDVIAIPQGRVIPHMGWNKVEIPGNMDIFEGIGKEKHFYFAHSYYADIKEADVKTAYTEYGFKLPAAVQKGNIYGTQFHPEKSGKAGLAVLKNFADICEKRKQGC